MSAVRVTDGQLSFDGGVNSDVPPSIITDANPDGLKRNMLAWLANGTVRGGGITQRTTWQSVVTVHDGSALYQGGLMYRPLAGNQYLVLTIGGRQYKVPLDGSAGVTDLTALFPGTQNPTTVDQGFYAQGERFLVIQAGDGVTLPLFWDGATLRRSIGINNNAVVPGTPGVNELPAAFSMDYYQQRLWYSLGNSVAAGDIVGGNSGTVPYQFTNAILNVTENPLVLGNGGDAFSLPSNAGQIRALCHSANLDATLGQGQLFIGTRKQIFALQVPVTRADWIAANSTNAPLLTIVQLNNGMVNDRSVVAVNGDLFFQSLEPSIRSLITAIRYFQQWGNTPISREIGRILQFNDRALMRFSTGIYFDNRLLQAVLPKQTPQGVVHQAIVPLDFEVISTLSDAKPPAWEGHWEGLNILQMFTGDFGGVERAFAVVVNEAKEIAVWELTTDQRFENGDNRVTWQVEFPAFNFGKEFDLKDLVGAELWIDKLFGTVEFELFWRVDGDPCLRFWHRWTECTQRNSSENPLNPILGYPQQAFRESYRATMNLPQPPLYCEPVMHRPAHRGYQFQPVLQIKGWCRVRGILLYANPVEKSIYENLLQANTAPIVIPRAPTPPFVPPTPPTPVVTGNHLLAQSGNTFTTQSGDQFITE